LLTIFSFPFISFTIKMCLLAHYKRHSGPRPRPRVRILNLLGQRSKSLTNKTKSSILAGTWENCLKIIVKQICKNWMPMRKCEMKMKSKLQSALIWGVQRVVEVETAEAFDVRSRVAR